MPSPMKRITLSARPPSIAERTVPVWSPECRAAPPNTERFLPAPTAPTAEAATMALTIATPTTVRLLDFLVIEFMTRPDRMRVNGGRTPGQEWAKWCRILAASVEVEAFVDL